MMLRGDETMASLTVENYCKAIRQLALKGDWPWVAPGQIASHLGVAPGTVTSMLRTLSDAMLAEYRPYEGVRLTAAGEGLASRVLRRHRLIESFLVQTLGLTWDQVHDEAEHMEHAMSDALVDRIDEYLGHPRIDPHGDPIPEADGRLRVDGEPGHPLIEAEVGGHYRMARVLDQSAEFLRHLTDLGLSLGVELLVEGLSEEEVLLAIYRRETEKGIRLTATEARKVLVVRNS